MRRDFWLLQAGQLLSEIGSHATTLAYPLLVLAVTGSPSQAGIVGFARMIPHAICGLPAGVIADRFDRRRVMIASDVVRALALVALALEPVFWMIVAVAFVDGAGAAFFRPAAAGALRSVVPLERLRDAAGVQQARIGAVGVIGPPLGGALFAIGRAVPFVFDAISYVGSIVFLALIRTPFQEVRERARVSMREGLRFLWQEPFLRITTILFGLLNPIGPALVLITIVVGRDQGLSGASIGLLLAIFSVGLFAGGLLSPLARRVLPSRVIVVLELWAWTTSAAFVVYPHAWVLATAMLPCALAIPITNSVVFGRGLEITPDRLVGRVESVRSTFALVSMPLGPLLAGVLLESTSARLTVAVFAGCSLVLALWATFSTALRSV